MYDAIIIGSGISGLVAALKLGEANLKVLIVTKSLNKSNSNLAQGGIIYSDDKFLADDIWNASSHTSSRDAINLICKQGPKIIKEVLLEKCDTKFTTKDNCLQFTKEAAHRIARIIYQGDYTGEAIIASLIKYIKKNKNIKIKQSCTAIDLIMPQDNDILQRYQTERVIGVYLLYKGIINKVLGKVIVLATGGVASIYAHSTNQEDIAGDGHAIAMRAGAILNNMEFIQFHPTVFFEKGYGRKFLLSEAMRGEGAVLRNKNGDRFMYRYHPDKELAPRDIVARSIGEEIIKTKSSHVFLDISKLNRNYLKSRFPKIFKYCLTKGIDISKDYIPVVPAAHYTCGGIKTDLHGRTNISGLYAVGEIASTGLHGANRLASTSLLEGLVFAYMAAEDIIKRIDNINPYLLTKTGDLNSYKGNINTNKILRSIHIIRQTMWNYVGLFRSNKNLVTAQNIIGEIELMVNTYWNKKITNELTTLRNNIMVAKSIIQASLNNNESKGCFYKE